MLYLLAGATDASIILNYSKLNDETFDTMTCKSVFSKSMNKEFCCFHFASAIYEMMSPMSTPHTF